MSEPIPQLGPLRLSTHIADLVLAAAGESSALASRSTRACWHVFFYSSVLLLVWHTVVRLTIAPSFAGDEVFIARVRLIESIIYAYLIVTVCALTITHYRYMLLPRKSTRIATFFFLATTTVLLFARLYYSMYYYNNELFSTQRDVFVRAHEFGIRGLRDLIGFLYFVAFSTSALLNCSFRVLESNSLVASLATTLETLIGYFYIGIVVATLVNVGAPRPPP